MIYIPENREELEQLKGKLTRVITPGWGRLTLVYYGVVDNDYEFMKQWYNWIDAYRIDRESVAFTLGGINSDERVRRVVYGKPNPVKMEFRDIQNNEKAISVRKSFLKKHKIWTEDLTVDNCIPKYSTLES